MPVDWIVKEISVRGVLDFEAEIFPFAEDQCAFHFKTEQDRDDALANGLGVIIGQLVPIETWVPDFVPGEGMVKMTMVWIQLPRLLRVLG